MEDFLSLGADSFDLTVTSIILAGGRGSRLGREKHAEVIAGKSLMERAIGQLSLLSREILIVISQSQAKSAKSINYPGAKTVIDLYPGKSSLGGIYTGLVNSTDHLNLVVACDMPFLNLGLLRYMVDVASDFDVVIPRIGDKMEPLHAIYSKNCVKPMENLIKQNNLKITAFFDSVKVKYVDEEELNRFDPEHLSFFNINTEADLEKARSMAAKESIRKQRK